MAVCTAGAYPPVQPPADAQDHQGDGTAPPGGASDLLAGEGAETLMTGCP